MAYKIGTDICNPKRIAKTYKRFGKKFLDRILTPKEKEYVMKSKKHFLTRLTGRYAAKEAVAKALETGIRIGVNFRDIEIVNGQTVPHLKLHGKAAEIAKDKNLSHWSVSISHEDIMVIATVIASNN